MTYILYLWHTLLSLTPYTTFVVINVYIYYSVSTPVIFSERIAISSRGMVQEPFSSFLKQASLAALISRLGFNGLLCLFHFGSRYLCFIPWFRGALKGSLTRVWDKLPQETLRKAVDSFRCRLEGVIQARR